MHATAGYSENDARFYYEREQLPELRVHMQSTQNKILHREPEEASKQTRTILVGKEPNLFKTHDIGLSQQD